MGRALLSLNVLPTTKHFLGKCCEHLYVGLATLWFNHYFYGADIFIFHKIRQPVALVVYIIPQIKRSLKSLLKHLPNYFDEWIFIVTWKLFFPAQMRSRVIIFWIRRRLDIWTLRITWRSPVKIWSCCWNRSRVFFIGTNISVWISSIFQNMM